MRSKKIVIALMILISLVNAICIIKGYREVISYSNNSHNVNIINLKYYNLRYYNIKYNSIIAYCIQVLNVILLIVTLKKKKHTKLLLIIVALLLIITFFIPVKYESNFTIEEDDFSPGFKNPNYVDKYKNIYSVTLKVYEYTKNNI